MKAKPLILKNIASTPNDSRFKRLNVGGFLNGVRPSRLVSTLLSFGMLLQVISPVWAQPGDTSASNQENLNSGAIVSPGYNSNASIASAQDTSNTNNLIGRISNSAGRRYPLGPHDVFSVTVVGFPELTSESVQVLPDGQVVLPFVGPLNVNGMTVEQLYRKLTEVYGKYYKNPQVSISMLETKTFRVYVTGAVINPGSYEIVTHLANRIATQPVQPDVFVN
ncbi:MAG: polysaccharide biosynthesis/export family protein, partial [Cyanobacteria bacterium]|nr:polysaccharide biosynthesis/export family protein [Cyanobacteriota bacterium]